MLKSFCIFILAILVTGCQTMYNQTVNPVPFGLYRGMKGDSPDGTPSFKTGWKDGCESGTAAYGSLHHKATHDYRYDPNMLADDEYHEAWKIGFRHCRWYTSSWLK